MLRGNIMLACAQMYVSLPPLPLPPLRMLLTLHFFLFMQVLLAWVVSNVRSIVFANCVLMGFVSHGLLLAGILGGGQSVDTFKPGGGITATKAYMTFVLAFVGLTSIIISAILLPVASERYVDRAPTRT
jgi:hypothetical protein